MNLIDIAKQYVNSREKGYAMIVPVDSDSYYLLSKQVLALQEQVRALAAENVAMKSDELVEFLRLVECMNSDHCEGNYGHSHEWIRHIFAQQHEYEEKFGDTPWGIASGSKYLATDAVLREIRAQGVEALRDSISDIDNGIETTIDLHHYCTDFAARIRSGDQP